MVLLNITLLITWTFVAPWKWERLPGSGVDRFGRPTDTYGTCESDNRTASTTFGILLLVVNLIPVFLANYQSYQARTLPTQFNESRYIALAMAKPFDSCSTWTACHYHGKGGSISTILGASGRNLCRLSRDSSFHVCPQVAG